MMWFMYALWETCLWFMILVIIGFCLWLFWPAIMVFLHKIGL